VTLREALQRYLPPFEAVLQEILTPGDSLFKPLYDMQRYHHGWLDHHLQPSSGDGGKCVRPLLCLLCCEASGGCFEQALPLAAAVELLHSFSLVHDDIQDRSATRRHRPTVWALWGEPQAINVGDSLHAAAHAALNRLRESQTAETVVELARAFEDTCLRLCEGQYLDMAFESEAEVRHERYLRMIERKTGALISYAAWGGARLGGQAHADLYREMGAALGLAFQIQDDVLGIWGDEAATGKSASSDIASAKKTLPLIYALGVLPGPDRRELAAIYAQTERSGSDVERARLLIDRSGARERCSEMVDSHHAQALRLLAQARPETAAGEALSALIGQLAGRQQ